MPDFRKNPPGRYGYLCAGCGMLALTFVGVQRPYADQVIEDLEVSQRGPHPSPRLTQLACQFCCYPIQIRDKAGHLIDSPGRSLVVEIDPWMETYQRQGNENRQRANLSPISYTRESHGVQRTVAEQRAFEKAVKEAAAARPEPTPAPEPPGKPSPDQFEANHPVVPEGTVDYAAVRESLTGKEK